MYCGQMRPKLSSLASTRLVVFGGREMLTITPRTPSLQSSTEVETLCFGAVFSAKGKGRLYHIEGQMDEAMYCKILDENLSQNTEDGSWMGLPA